MYVHLNMYFFFRELLKCVYRNISKSINLKEMLLNHLSLKLPMLCIHVFLYSYTNITTQDSGCKMKRNRPFPVGPSEPGKN